jgi:hypothetical protein
MQKMQAGRRDKMFILILHQFGNAEMAVVAVDERTGNNLTFETHKAAENYAADADMDVYDFTVLEV